jgi:hypothetical protein
LITKNWAELKIPGWLSENFDYILANLHSYDTIKLYAVNHDCGKHLVKVVDVEGKPHYPNHAQASHDYWVEHCPDKVTEARLILNDMFFHTCSAEELSNTTLDKKDLYTLLLTALAEIHANAQLFGGIDSTSFKIKYRQIERRGKQLLRC